MARLVTTVQRVDTGKVAIFGDDLLDAGFAAGDTVEVRSFEESMTVKTLSGQQLEILRLLSNSEFDGMTAVQVGEMRMNTGVGSYPLGEDAARSSLSRLIARGLVQRNGRPAKHWRTALGNQAVEEIRA